MAICHRRKADLECQCIVNDDIAAIFSYVIVAVKGSRLVGCRGSGRCREGRLEVTVDGSGWGTVCDDSFGTEDARVACNSLGFG